MPCVCALSLAGQLWLLTLNQALGGRGWLPVPSRTESGPGEGPGAERHPSGPLFVNIYYVDRMLQRKGGMSGIGTQIPGELGVGEGGGHCVVEDCPGDYREAGFCSD